MISQRKTFFLSGLRLVILPDNARELLSSRVLLFPEDNGTTTVGTVDVPDTGVRSLLFDPLPFLGVINKVEPIGDLFLFSPE